MKDKYFFHIKGKNLLTFLKTTILFISLIIIVPSYAETDLKSQAEALNMIADFADRICKDIPLEGSGENIKLSGKGKAELNNLIKYLVDIGIDGAGKYQKSEFKGVLRKDLKEMLKESSNCKLKVFLELKKIIPESLGSKEKENIADVTKAK